MKPFQTVFALFAFFAILCGATVDLHAGDGKPPLYLALFRLSIGEDGRVQDFQVAKVIDLLSGSNNAASVELPQSFISGARKKVEDELLKPTVRDGKPTGTGTLASFIYSPADEKHQPPGLPFSAFDGAMNRTSNFRLLGQDAAVSTYGAHFGSSACFVSYYALPLPKARKDQREAIVEAEVQRSAANVQNAEILSRKDVSTDAQTIMEVTCKTSRNKALTIRSRYICNDRQMLALTSVTPEGISAEETQTFDRLFAAFRFR
jgi:hypothetical protein